MSPSRSAVYRRKRIGLRTDPWGTLHSSDDVVEQDPLYRTRAEKDSAGFVDSKANK